MNDVVLWEISCLDFESDLLKKFEKFEKLITAQQIFVLIRPSQYFNP